MTPSPVAEHNYSLDYDEVRGGVCGEKMYGLSVQCVRHEDLELSEF